MSLTELKIHQRTFAISKETECFKGAFATYAVDITPQYDLVTDLLMDISAKELNEVFN